MKLISVVGLLVSAVGISSLAVPNQAPGALRLPALSAESNLFKRTNDTGSLRILTQNIQRNGVVASVKDAAVTPNFISGKPYTQLSDHYGVSAQLHFEFK
ncbi:hypothetical protein GGI12_004604 [Dipsacomyces acuminosporus]|nr:hypothetical protein GGI12_004604 [Dipsacomyces acuminosporus]